MAFEHFITGFRLLGKPGIRLWVVLPLLINIALFISLTALAIDYFSTLLGGLTGWLPDWLSFIYWLIWGLFGLTLLFIYAYTFTILANLIASPFFGVLAERTQYVLGYRPEAEVLSWASIKAIAWRSFVRELRKLVYSCREPSAFCYSASCCHGFPFLIWPHLLLSSCGVHGRWLCNIWIIRRILIR